MKFKSIITAAFFAITALSAAAQSNNIVEEVAWVVGDQPIWKSEIEAPRKATPTGPQLRQGINKLAGYRVQVFSDGRNQTTLETRAKARGNIIVSKFPKYRGQVYTYSSSPNWYCRVGNFQTEHEASEALRELKRAFPAFGGEMRVVRSQIVIIK